MPTAGPAHLKLAAGCAFVLAMIMLCCFGYGIYVCYMKMKTDDSAIIPQDGDSGAKLDMNGTKD